MKIFLGDPKSSARDHIGYGGPGEVGPQLWWKLPSLGETGECIHEFGPSSEPVLGFVPSGQTPDKGV